MRITVQKRNIYFLLRKVQFWIRNSSSNSQRMPTYQNTLPAIYSYRRYPSTRVLWKSEDLRTCLVPVGRRTGQFGQDVYLFVDFHPNEGQWAPTTPFESRIFSVRLKTSPKVYLGH
ncbi:hypothetical protein ABKN59_011791 [Abortiporus biennis]